MKILIFLISFILSTAIYAGLIVGKEEIAVVNYGTALSNDVSTVNTTDAIPIWTIPANTLIVDVTAYVTTTATGGNIIVGDGDDDNGYLSTGFEDTAGAYDWNDTTYRGAYLSSNTTPILSKFYSTADTIDVTLSATPLTTGQMTFFIKYKRLK